MRVVIFSGTTEGRRLSAETAAMGAETVVCVATEYGKTIQEHVQGTHVLSGRMDAGEMAKVLAGADLCIDATHPYATEASRNIRMAAENAKILCRRLLRLESELPSECIPADSAGDAARFLRDREGNILLTIGAKELTAFSTIERQRLYPRILPAQDSLAVCEKMEIPRSNIIAMQGPFSCELNTALIHQFSIRWLVTKDGGAVGGFTGKVQAAQETGARLVVIRRPKEEGEDYETILELCKEMIKCR